jgi:hypothetical protein
MDCIRNYLLIIFSCFALFGCSNSNLDEHGDYKEINLKSEIININPHYYGKGYQFDISNDTLIILNGYAIDTLFHVYNLKTSQLIGKFGNIGDAPFQVSAPGSFYWKKESNKIIIADNSSLNLKEFKILEALKNDDYKPTIINHPQNLAVVFFQPLNDSSFVTRQLDQTDDLLLTFNQDEIIDTIGKWYDNEDPIILFDKFQQYYYINNKHPSKNKFVASYFNYDVIQIVDAETGETIIVKGPAKISYKKSKSEFLGYRWVETSENYIYASYIGEFSNNDSNTSQYSKEIHVISWEGEHIAKLELDIPFRFFNVNEEQKVIYALADDDYGNFVKFRLPRL